MAARSKPTITRRNKDAEEPKCFYTVAAIAYYKRDGALKERTLNVLLELESPLMVKAVLGEIQQQVMRRMRAENNVEPGDFQDVVVLSITSMGRMPPSIFHGVQETPTAH